MKEYFIGIIFIVIFAASFIGCEKEQQIITDKAGTQIKYYIDDKTDNIIINGYTYQYNIEDDNLIFIYPNNEKVFIKINDNSLAVSSYSDEIENYVLPETLYNIYSENNKEFPYVNVITVIMGVLMIVIPKVFWYLEYGWAVGTKNYGIAIKVIQVIGVFIIFLGIFI